MSARRFKWEASIPDVNSVADVRKLCHCEFCKALGSNLPALTWRKWGKRELTATYAHAYCLVKEWGIDAMAALRSTEINKVTLNDTMGIASMLKIEPSKMHERVMKLVRAAEKRERTKNNAVAAEEGECP